MTDAGARQRSAVPRRRRACTIGPRSRCRAPAADGGGAGGGGGGGGFAAATRRSTTACRPRFQRVPGPVHHAAADDPAGRQPAVDRHHQPSYTAAGVDPAQPERRARDRGAAHRGPVARTRRRRTRCSSTWPTPNTKSLKVGATLPINGTDYNVVGLVPPDAHRQHRRRLLPARDAAEAGEQGPSRVHAGAREGERRRLDVDAVAAAIKQAAARAPRS